MKFRSPSLLVAGLLALGALLAAPPVVERLFFPLEWSVGDVRGPFAVLGGALAACAVLVLALRRRLDAAFARSFPDRRRLLFALVAIALGTGIALAVVEVALRVLNLPFSAKVSVSENALARFDDELGWTYQENLATEQVMDGGRPIPLFFDAIGARVGSPGAQTRAGEPSVLVVGGSVSMGDGLRHEDTYAARLDAMLADRQVVNLAVQAYGTDQALLRLERHIDRFETRAVVYGLICDHLQRNVVPDRRLLYPEARFVGSKPMFALSRDGQLELVARPRRYDEMRYSRLAAALRVLWTNRGPRPDPRVTRALIERMRDVSAERGARFVTLYWRSPWASPSCADELVGGLDVDVIDTTDELPRGWQRLPRGQHPSARAHARVARRLLAHLR